MDAHQSKICIWVWTSPKSWSEPYHKFCFCCLKFCTASERHALICILGHHNYDAWHIYCCLLVMTASNWMAAMSSHWIGAHGNVFRHTQRSPILVCLQSNRALNSVQILFDWASCNTHLYYPQFIIAHSNCHFTCTLETWFMCNKSTVVPLHAMKACRGVDIYSSPHPESQPRQRKVVSFMPHSVYPHKKHPSTLWTTSWVGSHRQRKCFREDRKSLTVARNRATVPWSSSSWPVHHTHYNSLVPIMCNKSCNTVLQILNIWNMLI